MNTDFEQRVEEVLGLLHGLAWPVLDEPEKRKLVGKVVRNIDRYGDSVAAWARALGVERTTLARRIDHYRRSEPIDGVRARAAENDRVRVAHAKAVLRDPDLSRRLMAEPGIAAAVARAATEHVNAKPQMPREPAGLDLNEAWQTWLSRLNALLMDGAALAERSEDSDVRLGAYAASARMMYARITERQIDAEIRELMDSERAREG